MPTEPGILQILQIIEQDATDASYKYALLRATTETIAEYPHLCEHKNDRVQIPVGILVHKWIVFYYPLMAADTFFPQKNGETEELKRGSTSAIRRPFIDLQQAYYRAGVKSFQMSYSQMVTDIVTDSVPTSCSEPLLECVRKIQDTITKMPMKYIGYSSTGSHYSLYTVESSRNYRGLEPNLSSIIKRSGTFSISYTMFEALRTLGGLISGQQSLFNQWAKFIVNASDDRLSIERTLQQLSMTPYSEREVRIAKSAFSQYDDLRSVWSGKKLSKYDVDHVIPFSVMYNNDLWNLLPTDPKENNQKRDKIPSPKLIKTSAERILTYWDYLRGEHTTKFDREFKLNLGIDLTTQGLHHGIEQLQDRSDYYISTRGMTAWNP